MGDKHRIRVDEDVWNVIRRVASPLVDTPNMALRRLLKIDKPAVEKRVLGFGNEIFSGMEVGDEREFKPDLGDTAQGLQGRIAAAASRYHRSTGAKFVTSARTDRFPGKVIMRRVA